MKKIKLIISILSLIILISHFVFVTAGSINDILANPKYNTGQLLFYIWLIANLSLTGIIYGNIKFIFAIKNGDKNNEIISLKIIKYGLCMIFLMCVAYAFNNIV